MCQNKRLKFWSASRSLDTSVRELDSSDKGIIAVHGSDSLLEAIVTENKNVNPTS